MQLLYNSDSFVVVRFDMPPAADTPGLQRGGYELVDKFAGKEIFIEGALADGFQRGVQELVKAGSHADATDAIDAFIAGYTALAQQPVSLH